jgi:hypothetical protein
MGILRRDADGVYRHVRGLVPWADRALDRIASEDRAKAEAARQSSETPPDGQESEQDNA